jgi:cyanophycinase
MATIFKERRSEGRGLLALIGGSEDRKSGNGLLARIVLESRAQRVAVVPAASTAQEELDRDYREVFLRLGVPQVEPLVVRDRSQADSPMNLEKIEGAELIFFTGGSQVRLLETLEGTRLAELILKKHLGGTALAGTSAGAAAAGEWTIFYGDGHGTEKEASGWRRGFGFLPGLTVDTHFLERSRIYRLAQFLAAGFCRYGLGLPEDTAVLVGPDGIMEAVGSGVVTVMDGGHITSNNYHRVEKGAPVSVNGIRLGFLPAGSRFDITRWEMS